MPIYEFRCRSCGAQFEKLVISADDAKDILCASCASQDVEKILSAGAVRAGKNQSGSFLPQGGGCSGKSGFS